ncbi:MAG: hypothetical protein JW718_01515 [Desulfovibrionaceae bacterium]|nr:hypothetical protein [Desulfovibrionaceae bacterium]
MLPSCLTAPTALWPWIRYSRRPSSPWTGSLPLTARTLVRGRLSCPASARAASTAWRRSFRATPRPMISRASLSAVMGLAWLSW